MTVELDAWARAAPGEVLGGDSVEGVLADALTGRHAGLDVVVVIPDHTRSLPLAWLLSALVGALGDCRRVTVVVALGTHPPLGPAQLDALVGRGTGGSALLESVEVVNHDWQDPRALVEVGILDEDQLRAIAGDCWHDSLAGDVVVRVNRRVVEADHVVILGPTFPHEVVGFSGGYKYFFPGLSGPEMIDRSHWLGALCGVADTIGVAETPVREMVHAAASLVDTPVTMVSLVVVGSDDLAGVFVGHPIQAWRAAAELSDRRHVVRVDRPFERVLSWAPPMYDELWTAAKAAYKLEQVVAGDGELIIYAPHLAEISRVHGADIRRVGYHSLAWILDRWDAVGHLPLAVLAHSTHVRGPGEMVDGEEQAHHDIVLASQIPQSACAEVGLGYLDPDTIDPDEWRGREADGVLFVERAGETLYRLT